MSTTNPELSTYLTHLTHLTPLSPFSLPPTDRTCPICYEPYLPYAVLSPHPSNPQIHPEGEYPVRVRSLHPHTQCRHVFGSKCIEAHLRSQGPWCTRCPTCREEWFDWPEDARWGDEERGREGVRMQLPRLREIDVVGDEGVRRGEVYAYPHVTRVYAVREVEQLDGRALVPGQGAGGGGVMTEEDGLASWSSTEDVHERRGERTTTSNADASGLGNRGRIDRTIGFLERMLRNADVRDGDAEVAERVVALEVAAESLWGKVVTRREDVQEESVVDDTPRPGQISVVQMRQVEQTGQ
ncbi:hypothetical protein M011DRAFT_523003 [Sporormia fimetaria CBS 119925]|uniref:RING-type domain-containing protein n=1 Tax=Sporormia fimetaria CBS 119925 TaxID=1340428 RepID=A0A6A6VNF7_9PLEO|nr:hypothetical protein M011DRAFT_523003 [Sporormia fimetaria CBS 119925]